MTSSRTQWKLQKRIFDSRDLVSNVFKKFDSNEDGTVSENDLVLGFQTLGLPINNSNNLRELMNSCRSKNDNRINYSNFLNNLEPKATIPLRSVENQYVKHPKIERLINSVSSSPNRNKEKINIIETPYISPPKPVISEEQVLTDVFSQTQTSEVTSEIYKKIQLKPAEEEYFLREFSDVNKLNKRLKEFIKPFDDTLIEHTNKSVHYQPSEILTPIIDRTEEIIIFEEIDDAKQRFQNHYEANVNKYQHKSSTLQKENLIEGLKNSGVYFSEGQQRYILDRFETLQKFTEHDSIDSKEFIEFLKFGTIPNDKSEKKQKIESVKNKFTKDTHHVDSDLVLDSALSEKITKQLDMRIFSKVFRSMDTEKLGALDRKQFRKGLENVGVYLSNDEFSRVLNYVDPNKTDTIVFDAIAQFASDTGSKLDPLKSPSHYRTIGDEYTDLSIEDRKLKKLSADFEKRAQQKSYKFSQLFLRTGMVNNDGCIEGKDILPALEKIGFNVENADKKMFARLFGVDNLDNSKIDLNNFARIFDAPEEIQGKINIPSANSEKELALHPLKKQLLNSSVNNTAANPTGDFEVPKADTRRVDQVARDDNFFGQLNLNGEVRNDVDTTEFDINKHNQYAVCVSVEERNDKELDGIVKDAHFSNLNPLVVEPLPMKQFNPKLQNGEIGRLKELFVKATNNNSTHLKYLLNKADRDHDGVINSADVAVLMSQLGVQPQSNEDKVLLASRSQFAVIKSITKGALNNDGSISIDRFIDSLPFSSTSSKETIKPDVFIEMDPKPVELPKFPWINQNYNSTAPLPGMSPRMGIKVPENYGKNRKSRMHPDRLKEGELLNSIICGVDGPLPVKKLTPSIHVSEDSVASLVQGKDAPIQIKQMNRVLSRKTRPKSTPNIQNTSSKLMRDVSSQIMKRTKRNPRRLVEEFRLTDRGEQGFIKSIDFVKSLKSSGIQLNNQETNGLLQELDPLKTGHIPYRHFIDKIANADSLNDRTIDYPINRAINRTFISDLNKSESPKHQQRRRYVPSPETKEVQAFKPRLDHRHFQSSEIFQAPSEPLKREKRFGRFNPNFRPHSAPKFNSSTYFVSPLTPKKPIMMVKDIKSTPLTPSNTQRQTFDVLRDPMKPLQHRPAKRMIPQKTANILFF
eukprot:TRINITY_DN3180_c0_g1_i4.p1 TRINITY_DN3180_c0_g1~~TRINITY_DN3180_c0_g1_i4.p1  ORF type:complete len:1144 (+),score=375.96 TRINITY_DN3180_c0_g1_i4:97-3528(+)